MTAAQSTNRILRILSVLSQQKKKLRESVVCRTPNRGRYMLYHRQLEFNTSEDKATKIFDTIS